MILEAFFNPNDCDSLVQLLFVNTQTGALAHTCTHHVQLSCFQFYPFPMTRKGFIMGETTFSFDFPVPDSKGNLSSSVRTYKTEIQTPSYRLLHFLQRDALFSVPGKGKAMDELGMSSALTMNKGNFSLKLYRLYKYVAQVEFL